jgi:hypothetical protein
MLSAQQAWGISPVREAERGGGWEKARVECQRCGDDPRTRPWPDSCRRKIMRVVVREVVNEPGNPFEEGQKVHDLISPALARGEPVELDFEGVRFLDVPFLNAAVGQLLKEIDLERVKALLRAQNLSALDRSILEGVIERASRYYTEPRYREAIDRFLARMFEDQ